MTTEAMPVDTSCNLGCTYCYQEPMRLATDNKYPAYDLDAMKATLGSRKEPFTVFGGEPLLMPIADLEELWAFGLERWPTLPEEQRKKGSINGIQTNAALVTDEHVRLFKKYKVHVGVSLDGPGELNDARRSGTLEATRATTQKSCAALERLLEEKVPCSLIVTLHRLNATEARLPQLQQWLFTLAAKGLKDIRLHALEVDSVSAELLALTEDEQVAALLALRETSVEAGIEVDVFKDLGLLLEGNDKNVTCVWNGCDPWRTPAVQAVAGDGSMRNCGRTNKDGSNWEKTGVLGQMRQIVLYNTPYEDGGCKGCRFFVACKGYCPGHAIDGDPRNRPVDCRIWIRLFTVVEKELLMLGRMPVSRHPLRERIEQSMLGAWAQGLVVSVADGITMALGDGTVKALKNSSGGNQPHGDQHQDHYDYAAALAEWEARNEAS